MGSCDLRSRTQLGAWGVHYLGYLEGPRPVDAFASAGVVVAPSRKDPAPLVASEALAAGRPLVLGPGVGNAHDLRRLSPETVNVMATASASELIGSVCKVLGRVVTPAVRAAFTPSSCAEAFLKGTEIMLPGETSIRQTVSNDIEVGLSKGGDEVLPIGTLPYLGSHQVLRADRAKLASSGSLGTSTEHRDGWT